MMAVDLVLGLWLAALIFVVACACGEIAKCRRDIEHLRREVDRLDHALEAPEPAESEQSDPVAWRGMTL